MNNIDKNYNYFKKEKNSLKKKYSKEFIVICNEKVIFHNKDLNKVIEFARYLEAGKYIIQKCEKNETKNIETFCTRVTF